MVTNPAPPFSFIQETVHEFENPKEPDTIIPVNWFDDRRTVTIRVPYCKTNEQQSYAFIKKLERFTRGHCILQSFGKQRD